MFTYYAFLYRSELTLQSSFVVREDCLAGRVIMEHVNERRNTRKLATSPKNEKVEGILRHTSNEKSKMH